MAKHKLTLRKLRQRLAAFGITEDPARGKGSHTVFILQIADDKPLALEGKSDKEILCHLELLIEAGRVDGTVMHDDSRTYPRSMFTIVAANRAESLSTVLGVAGVVAPIPDSC